MCRHGQAPLGVTPDTGAEEISRQLAQLAQQYRGRTQRRLEHAALMASPAEGGLHGKMLCFMDADELLDWFEGEGLGDPPVNKGTITLIRRELLPGALRVSPWPVSSFLVFAMSTIRFSTGSSHQILPSRTHFSCVRGRLI